MTTRVLIAGDRPLIRLGLEAVVAQQPTIACRGSIAAAAMVEHLIAEPVQVLVLDLDDCTVPALPLIDQLRRDTTVTIVVCTDAVGLAPELIRAGVRGILTLAEAPEQLHSAIQAAQATQPYLSPTATRAIDTERAPLTQSEIRVVALLAQGLGTVQIAHQMGINPRSAQNYLTTLRRKLGCAERVQLVRWYRQNGSGLSR